MRAQLSTQQRTALHVLLRGWDLAAEHHQHVSDFAVAVPYVRSLGITAGDVRWLVSQGYAVTNKRRVVVLTAAGAEAARQLEQEEASVQPDCPVYDRDLRELWLGNVLVKRLRRPAPIQHTILCSFQELGWPRRMDDPLPPEHGGQDPKLRVRDSIKRLNRNQHAHLIRFRGGGTGLEITWESQKVRSHRKATDGPQIGR